MSEDSLRIGDRARVEDTMAMLARRIDAEISGDITVVGILRRGKPLADMLVEYLDTDRRRVELGEIKLKRYSDELDVLHETPKLDRESLDVDVEGKAVVLVDDVLFTGRTMLKASYLFSELGAESIHAVVLCRRGADQLEVPIQAEFAGIALEVGENWIVDVNIPPFEDEVAIWINRRPEE